MYSKNLVSIILPVYNGETHIEQSINSILAQTYENIELIIVNDCSTDHTSDIVNKYAQQDSRITIINNEVNLKLPKTLNVGFANAHGTYLTWTSDDNIYEQNAIEVMANTLEKSADIDMVYANMTYIDEKNNIIEYIKLDDPTKLVITNPIGACFLYTKNIADKVGKYDADLFLAEDYDYWIRINKNGKIMHISDNLYQYRWHSNSLTETRKEAIQLQTYKTIEKNFYSLYLLSITTNQKYQFFDHIINRTRNEQKGEVRKQLVAISPDYKRYLEKKELKSRLRSSFLYKLLKKIKVNHFTEM